jgi:acetoin utilization protein AcuB
MTRAPLTAVTDDTLIDAAARMAARGVRHLPVIDGDRRVVGMLSDRDVRSQVGQSSLQPLDLEHAGIRTELLRVGDVMTKDVFVLRHDASFSEVTRVFTGQRVGAVPIVDDQDHLIGIISYVDVFKNAGAL